MRRAWLEAGLFLALAVPMSVGQAKSESTTAAPENINIVGHGTAGKIPKFVGRRTIGDSIMFEANGEIDVHGSLNAEVQSGPGIALRGGNPTTDGSTEIDASYGSGIRGVIADTSSPAGISVFAINDASTGDPIGVFGKTVSTFRGIGVRGQAVADSGGGLGVLGEAASPDGVGIVGSNFSDHGNPVAIIGSVSSNDRGTAILGRSASSSGSGVGVEGQAFSADGVAGAFDNVAGGNILTGISAGATRFRVDGAGTVFANGGFQPGGADFAESMAVAGDQSKYAAGDLLVIDSTGSRRLAIAQQAYSTLVAGIYSTKPGMVGSTRNADEPRPKSEVPLAVVGIVPCKVTSENGAIEVGDLLVTSSRPGRAMKGTDRSRMLGAVVGKALEPLAGGEGTIQVLVTLQ